MLRYLPLPLVFMMATGGCSAAGTPPLRNSSHVNYAETDRWACLPGRNDPCSQPRAIVEALPDGSLRPTTDALPRTSDQVDCFYVYPTISMSVIPRNADNFRHNGKEIAQIIKVQAASFRSSCRLFVPLYRQATIGTYILPEKLRQKHLRKALSDVTAAFDYYMANYNNGRKIVLIGHSQGAEIVTRLMQDRFDRSEAMRKQLLLAIIAGIPVQVPIGKTVGGTFVNIPTCTRPGEVSCYVTFKSYIAGSHPISDTRLVTPPGQEAACVNPATLDDPKLSIDGRRSGRAVLKGTLLPPPAWSMGSVQGDKTSHTFRRVAGGYSAACVQEPASRLSYLAIAQQMPPGDPRRAFISFTSGKLNGSIGLHVLDMQFPSSELVALVRARRPTR